jgi:hypothetical protein
MGVYINGLKFPDVRLYIMELADGTTQEEHGESITDVMNFMARSYPHMIVTSIVKL